MHTCVYIYIYMCMHACMHVFATCCVYIYIYVHACSYACCQATVMGLEIIAVGLTLSILASSVQIGYLSIIEGLLGVLIFVLARITLLLRNAVSCLQIIKSSAEKLSEKASYHNLQGYEYQQRIKHIFYTWEGSSNDIRAFLDKLNSEVSLWRQAQSARGFPQSRAVLIEP